MIATLMVNRGTIKDHQQRERMEQLVDGLVTLRDWPTEGVVYDTLIHNLVATYIMIINVMEVADDGIAGVVKLTKQIRGQFP